MSNKTNRNAAASNANRTPASKLSPMPVQPAPAGAAVEAVTTQAASTGSGGKKERRAPKLRIQSRFLRSADFVKRAAVALSLPTEAIEAIVVAFKAAPDTLRLAKSDGSIPAGGGARVEIVPGTQVIIRAKAQPKYADLYDDVTCVWTVSKVVGKKLVCVDGEGMRGVFPRMHMTTKLPTVQG